MVAVLMMGPAVQMSGVIGWLAALAVSLCAYALAVQTPDTRRARVLIALLVVAALITAGATVMQAAVIYDLKVYCESIYGWFDPTCWGL